MGQLRSKCGSRLIAAHIRCEGARILDPCGRHSPPFGSSKGPSLCQGHRKKHHHPRWQKSCNGARLS
eukprot:4613001-Pyramimonas_sp.AAC.1